MNNVKQDIQELAKYCNVTPQMATNLHRFFLDVATKEEEKAIDNWINERPEHDQLFDLLCNLNREGTGAGSLHEILKLANKDKPKKSKFKIWGNRVFWAAVVIVVGERLFYPSGGPLSRWIIGPDENFVSVVIESGDTARTQWLPDSTRVDLLPHSKLGFSYNEIMHPRKVVLWGSAKFEIRDSDGDPFSIKTGEGWIEYPKGNITILADSTGNLVVQRQTP